MVNEILKITDFINPKIVHIITFNPILNVLVLFEERVDETSNKLSYNVSGLKLGVRSTKLSLTCSANS